MRIWETEDNKAIPSNLVREQDFVLRVRSMKRVSTKYFVVNLLLSSCAEPLEEALHRIQAFADQIQCTYNEMSNGDVFLTCIDSPEANSIPKAALMLAAPDGLDDISKYFLIYHMPNDYTALRERANYYIEDVRTSSALGEKGTPAQVLLSDAARGPLTAWSLNQVENLLNDIDLQSYLRMQSVYEKFVDGSWAPLYEEYFIGFEELKRAHFPKLEISPTEHLFMELCQSLDKRLLTEMTQNYDIIKDRKISLNLSVSSVMETAFAQFAFCVPRANHGYINFELNRGDLLQDFSHTLSAIATLQREGFKISIDDVIPETLEYVNFAKLETDYIKLNVSKLYADQLNSPAIKTCLAKIPSEKLIFYRCDNEPALKLGTELGITKFQGWLVDKYAAKEK